MRLEATLLWAKLSPFPLLRRGIALPPYLMLCATDHKFPSSICFAVFELHVTNRLSHDATEASVAIGRIMQVVHATLPRNEPFNCAT